MRPWLFRALVSLAAFALSAFSGSASAASFTVVDGSFDGSGVYTFRYVSRTNVLQYAGTTVLSPSSSTLFLSNTGFVRDTSDPSVGFWRAIDDAGGFGSAQLSGVATMGWDLSAVTGHIASVELWVSSFLFSFDPWEPHAWGDAIYGDVATPASFGAGSYTSLYSHLGPAPLPGSASVGAVGRWGASSANFLPIDLGAVLGAAWLANPGLLELRFGYQQAPVDASHPTAPGRHIQIFRDPTHLNDLTNVGDGFLLRVTLAVPEPGGLAFAIPLAAALAAAARRRTRVGM